MIMGRARTGCKCHTETITFSQKGSCLAVASHVTPSRINLLTGNSVSVDTNNLTPAHHCFCYASDITNLLAYHL